MIEYSHGDMFKSGAKAFVCPVNTVGTMGKGLALTFKRKFPWCVEPYETACKNGAFRIGDIIPVESHTTPSFYVLHVPTKNHWRDPSKVKYVERAVGAICAWARQHQAHMDARDNRPIAVPALGCGLGGIEFEDVESIFEDYFSRESTTMIVYLPK